MPVTIPCVLAFLHSYTIIFYYLTYNIIIGLGQSLRDIQREVDLYSLAIPLRNWFYSVWYSKQQVSTYSRLCYLWGWWSRNVYRRNDFAVLDDVYPRTPKLYCINWYRIGLWYCTRPGCWGSICRFYGNMALGILHQSMP